MKNTMSGPLCPESVIADGQVVDAAGLSTPCTLVHVLWPGIIYSFTNFLMRGSLIQKQGYNMLTTSYAATLQQILAQDVRDR